MWDINGRVESLPLTNTRDKSGWVESIYSPQLNCEDFFWRISMIKTGFYIIKDNFFDIVNDPFLKGNKQGNRPHYYCFEDLKTGIYWIIPMSSKLEKYKKISTSISSKVDNFVDLLENKICYPERNEFKDRCDFSSLRNEFEKFVKIVYQILVYLTLFSIVSIFIPLILILIYQFSMYFITLLTTIWKVIVALIYHI